jgi:hypothetical protein
MQELVPENKSTALEYTKNLTEYKSVAKKLKFIINLLLEMYTSR